MIERDNFFKKNYQVIIKCLCFLKYAKSFLHPPTKNTKIVSRSKFNYTRAK